MQIAAALVGGVATLIGGAVVLAWRVRETMRPVTAKSIVLPPLGMATGFCMFAAPQMRVPLSWAVCALLAGTLLLSYPLVHTSSLHRSGDVVLLKRSPAFLVVLLALVFVRIVARRYVEERVSTMQTGAIFFLVAFGMIVPWRVAMYRRYRALTRDDGDRAI